MLYFKCETILWFCSHSSCSELMHVWSPTFVHVGLLVVLSAKHLLGLTPGCCSIFLVVYLCIVVILIWAVYRKRALRVKLVNILNRTFWQKLTCCNSEVKHNYEVEQMSTLIKLNLSTWRWNAAVFLCKLPSYIYNCRTFRGVASLHLRCEL